jgi:hypothetical protein
MSPAMSLLAELMAGGAFFVDGGEGPILAADPKWFSEELVERVRRHKRELHELLWRVKAMRRQVPAAGAVPILQARPGLDAPEGACVSCGEPLPASHHYRCALCLDAATLSLGTRGKEHL